MADLVELRVQHSRGGQPGAAVRVQIGAGEEQVPAGWGAGRAPTPTRVCGTPIVRQDSLGATSGVSDSPNTPLSRTANLEALTNLERSQQAHSGIVATPNGDWPGSGGNLLELTGCWLLPAEQIGIVIVIANGSEREGAAIRPGMPAVGRVLLPDT